MARLRITGLVRIADRVRLWLADGAPDSARSRVERMAREALTFVDRTVSEENATLAALPAPSRRAYSFLKSVDFDAPRAANSVESAAADAPRRFSLRGARRNWDTILVRLSRPLDHERRRGAQDFVKHWRDEIQKLLERESLDESAMTAQSTETVAWVRFFAEPGNFERYCQAVQFATEALDPRLQPGGRFPPPGRVEFCLTRSVFDVSKTHGGTRFRLAIGFVALDGPGFRELAAVLLGGADRGIVRRLLARPECRAIDDALHAQVAQPLRSAGAYFDLAAAFERVNRDYFESRLPVPRLTWSRTLTSRKFGHYEPRRDRVMLSRTLDRADVPAYVVEFVLYHELLHKALGIQEVNGRCAAHTPEFRTMERRFAKFEEAERWLRQLAREG